MLRWPAPPRIYAHRSFRATRGANSMTTAARRACVFAQGPPTSRGAGGRSLVTHTAAPHTDGSRHSCLTLKCDPGACQRRSAGPLKSALSAAFRSVGSRSARQVHVRPAPHISRRVFALQGRQQWEFDKRATRTAGARLGSATAENGAGSGRLLDTGSVEPNARVNGISVAAPLIAQLTRRACGSCAIISRSGCSLGEPACRSL